MLLLIQMQCHGLPAHQSCIIENLESSPTHFYVDIANIISKK